MLSLTGCTVNGNTTRKDGGGIYSDKKLTLVDCTVTGNSASEKGGGVFVANDSDDTNIGGKLVVKDNSALIKGKDLFLRTNKLVVSTAMTQGSQAGITKDYDSGLDVFTSGYSAKNGSEDPALYFFSPEGLGIAQGAEGEASLVSGWKDLRAEIANAQDGATITLTHSYTASSKDDYLEIPKNKTLTTATAPLRTATGTSSG